MQTKTRTLIIYLAALTAFAPMSTDIYLASMPTIEKLFDTSTAHVQLTLSLFFVTFAIAQLIWGPLSDRFGRKPIIYTGIIIFMISSLICAWSENITTLIIARIFQALGACASPVMSISIVKDIFTDNREMSKVLSKVMAIMIIAPMVAPIIGSYLLVTMGWESNFYFLALYALVLLVSTFFIQESYPKASRTFLPTNKLIHAYTEQTKCLPFLLAILAVSTNFSVMFSFISSSSFIYIKIYNLPESLFGYFFAANACALILGTQFLNRLKLRISDQHIILIALSISSIASVIMLMALLLFPQLIWSVVIPSFFVTFGVGILFPELMSQGLKHVVAYTGLASSIAGTVRFILAAAVGFILGALVENSAIPLALMMLVMNILTGALMLGYFSKLANNKPEGGI